MEITTFSCKNCGANIKTPDFPGAVICSYCGSNHRVSFQGGSVVAELVAKVRQLDEDVARLKGGTSPPKGPPGLRERLARIDEGKRKWHDYVTSVKAGKSEKSPEMVAVYKGALADLLAGYGSGNGELINDYCNPRFLDYNPTAGYSCLFILIGIIILVGMLGVIKITVNKTVPGIILVSVALVAVAAGIPSVINMIRIDKSDLVKSKEALRRLDAIEAEMRRRMSGDEAK